MVKNKTVSIGAVYMNKLNSESAGSGTNSRVAVCRFSRSAPGRLRGAEAVEREARGGDDDVDRRASWRRVAVRPRRVLGGLLHARPVIHGARALVVVHVPRPRRRPSAAAR